MTISARIARQLSHPTGSFAGLAGRIWNRRNAELNERMLELLDLQPSDRVLDVGFGGGYLLERMSAVVTSGRLEGVDVSAAMVRQAEKRFRKEIRDGKLKFTCAAVEALPYPDGSFTKVCSVNSIFYWQDAEKGIREMERVLASSGRAGLCFTRRASIERKRFAGHIRLFESEEVIQMLSAAGLKNTQMHNLSDPHRQYAVLLAKKT